MKKFLVFGLILAAMTGALMTSCDDGSTTTVEKAYNLMEIGAGAGYSLLPANSGKDYVAVSKLTAAQYSGKPLVATEQLTEREILEKYDLEGTPAGLIDDLAAGYAVVFMVISPTEKAINPETTNKIGVVVWE